MLRSSARPLERDVSPSPLEMSTNTWPSRRRCNKKNNDVYAQDDNDSVSVARYGEHRFAARCRQPEIPPCESSTPGSCPRAWSASDSPTTHTSRRPGRSGTTRTRRCATSPRASVARKCLHPSKRHSPRNRASTSRPANPNVFERPSIHVYLGRARLFDSVVVLLSCVGTSYQ